MVYPVDRGCSRVSKSTRRSRTIDKIHLIMKRCKMYVACCIVIGYVFEPCEYAGHVQIRSTNSRSFSPDTKSTIFEPSRHGGDRRPIGSPVSQQRRRGKQHGGCLRVRKNCSTGYRTLIQVINAMLKKSSYLTSTEYAREIRHNFQ